MWDAIKAQETAAKLTGFRAYFGEWEKISNLSTIILFPNLEQKEKRPAKHQETVKDVLEVRGGGEEAVMKLLKEAWTPLQERMKNDDGTGERKFSFHLNPNHWLTRKDSNVHRFLRRSTRSLDRGIFS